MDLDVKVPQIVLVRDGADARNAVGSCCVNGYGSRQTDLDMGGTHGSAINRSVSLMIRFGSAMLTQHSGLVRC